MDHFLTRFSVGHSTLWEDNHYFGLERRAGHEISCWNRRGKEDLYRNMQFRFYLHRLIETPIGLIVCEPRIGRTRRIELSIEFDKRVSVLDETLGHLRDFGTADQQIALQKHKLEQNNVC